MFAYERLSTNRSSFSLSSILLNSSLVKKMTKLEKLVADAATKESLVKVDNKFENYIRSLKKAAT